MEIHEGDYRRLTEPELRSLSEETETEYKYVTIAEYRLVMPDGRMIIVPPGFLTDGSSKSPDLGKSWIFHDWLYATHHWSEEDDILDLTTEFERMNTSSTSVIEEMINAKDTSDDLEMTRREADDIMAEILRIERGQISRFPKFIRRWVWWSFRRKFIFFARHDFTGAFEDAWITSWQRGAEFIEMVEVDIATRI